LPTAAQYLHGRQSSSSTASQNMPHDSGSSWLKVFVCLELKIECCSTKAAKGVLTIRPGSVCIIWMPWGGREAVSLKIANRNNTCRRLLCNSYTLSISLAPSMADIITTHRTPRSARVSASARPPVGCLAWLFCVIDGPPPPPHTLLQLFSTACCDMHFCRKAPTASPGPPARRPRQGPRWAAWPGSCA